MARILVVEDDPGQLEVRKLILEQAGHEVVTAGDASNAIETLPGCQLVLMDFRIPTTEDGLRLIRAASGQARIVVLSGAQPDVPLPVDEVLTYAPAIYQEMVVKQFDVRMVLLGQAVFSYALHNPKGALDWRQDAGQGLVQVEPIVTPPDVEAHVLAFASRSGIAYGSFDFAVDAQGKWWFLEVNEGGQFLWLDEFNPNVHMQEKFSAFLTSPGSSSKQSIEERQSLFPSWKGYLASPAKDEVLPEEVDSEATFVSTEP